MAIKKKAEEVKAGVGDYATLISPIVTEKAAHGAGSRTRVVFRVQKTASKKDIRQAVERVFKVKVAQVRTANFMGKVKRTTSMMGRRAAYKKAYVTLEEGQTIAVVEGL